MSRIKIGLLSLRRYYVSLAGSTKSITNREQYRADKENGMVKLVIESDIPPEVDVWGARRRKNLFEKYFDCEMQISWAGGEIPEYATDKSVLEASDASDSLPVEDSNGNGHPANHQSDVKPVAKKK